jgi:rhodanese-related sulfurtransferase
VRPPSGAPRRLRALAAQAVIIISLALFPALGAAVFHPKRPSWTRPTEIEPALAHSWGRNVLWVDARSRADFERGHVPGAVLLNEGEWEQLIDPFLDAWRRGVNVVVYCSSRNCDASAEVARRLRDDAQIENVYVLKGGWEAWQALQK